VPESSGQGSATATGEVTDNPVSIPVVLKHWLSRPVEGTITLGPPRDMITPGGLQRSCPTATLRLEHPIVADPGWIVAFHPAGQPANLCHAVITEVGRESAAG
jgi:hypothetical protein